MTQKKDGKRHNVAYFPFLFVFTMKNNKNTSNRQRKNAEFRKNPSVLELGTEFALYISKPILQGDFYEPGQPFNVSQRNQEYPALERR